MGGTSTLLFWVLAAAIGTITAALLVRPMFSRDAAEPQDNADIQVYKDQLAEVDRDIARGTLEEAEGEALKTEISRRLLAAADTATRAASGPPPASVAVAIAAATIALGLGTYLVTGAPGTPDQPLTRRIEDNRAAYAARPSQAQMEAQLAEATAKLDPLDGVPPDQRALLDRLLEVLEERPDDLRGHELLEGFLSSIQDWSGAARAQARVVELKGDTATAQDHLTLAEHLIFAVNGYVSPEAENALREVLNREPRNSVGRYFSGLAALQGGRPDITYGLWTALLGEGPADAPWIAAIEDQIRDVALAAGRPVPERTRPGPSQDDIDAAGAMSAEARDEMIRGMVAGLSDRLATEGGPAEDWARLIRSLGVLGERAEANAVLQEALGVFAASPADLDILREAGRDAEVLQ